MPKMTKFQITTLPIMAHKTIFCWEFKTILRVVLEAHNFVLKKGSIVQRKESDNIAFLHLRAHFTIDNIVFQSKKCKTKAKAKSRGATIGTAIPPIRGHRVEPLDLALALSLAK